MEITNNMDVIDSRDIIERIEELEEEEEDFDENSEELEALKSLASEAEGCGDWGYGEALIRESYFSEYCEELCKDIGDIPKDLPYYIANNIDWDGVASDLKADYTEVDFDGVTYCIRS